MLVSPISPRGRNVPHLNFSTSSPLLSSRPSFSNFKLNESSYPPFHTDQCLSVPMYAVGRRHISPNIRSAPQFCGGSTFVKDVFVFGEEDCEPDDQISYHQRKHSAYPHTPPDPKSSEEKEGGKATASPANLRRPPNPRPSPLAAETLTPSSNPWKTPMSTHSSGSALIPKVVPVSVRVTRMLKEFSMEFYEELTSTDNLAHINKSVRENITDEIRNIVKATARSPRIASPRRKPDTCDIVHTALLKVTESIIAQGIDVESFSRTVWRV